MFYLHTYYCRIVPVVIAENEMLYMMGHSGGLTGPTVSCVDGNEEATMAVIMSLLESEAGLSADLPWSLS